MSTHGLFNITSDINFTQSAILFKNDLLNFVQATKIAIYKAQPFCNANVLIVNII